MIRSSRTEDVFVRILPGLNANRHEDSAVRAYEVAVYSDSTFDVSDSEPSRAPQEFMQVPLRIVGRLALKWARYQDILGQFFEEEKGMEAMHYRLLDALSHNLRQLIDEVQAKRTQVCVWWSSEAPELEDMPWELLFYGNPATPTSPNFNFVRGTPPEMPTPVLPLSGPLRLLWPDTPATPPWVRDLFESNKIPGVSAIPFANAIRQRLRSAADEGIELAHLCSDGSVSLAYEGVLNSFPTDEPGLSAAELSDIVRGSRLTVMGFTAINQAELNPSSEAGGVVAVYRAFAYLASSRVRLPSIVAPVGPTDPMVSQQFWTTFYSTLGQQHRLDASFAIAKQATRASTFALFFRHSHGKLFRQIAEDAPVPSPARMATDLQSSLDLSERLQSLTAKYGPLPDYVNSFAVEEKERRHTIETELNKWTATEAEE